jgi:hypothetical protein
VFADLSRRIDELIASYERIRDSQVAAFNALLKSSEVPAVVLPKKKDSKR